MLKEHGLHGLEFRSLLLSLVDLCSLVLYQSTAVPLSSLTLFFHILPATFNGLVVLVPNKGFPLLILDFLLLLEVGLHKLVVLSLLLKGIHLLTLFEEHLESLLFDVLV